MSFSIKESLRAELAAPTAKELVEDLQSLQRSFPDVTITRNFYRAHTTHLESEWQYHFSTFNSFMVAARLRDELQPVFDTSSFLSNYVDMTDYQEGDTFNIGNKTFKLLKKRGSCVSVKRYYWFDRLYDRVFGKDVKTWESG